MRLHDTVFILYYITMCNDFISDSPLSPCRAVVSNSICLGAAGSSSWVLPGRTEPFAKGNVNFAERMDVAATIDCREGCYWEKEERKEAWGRSLQKIFRRPRPSLWQ